MAEIGWPELLVIGLVFVLLFGTQKIPGMMKGLGEGIRNFKTAVEGRDRGNRERDRESLSVRPVRDEDPLAQIRRPLRQTQAIQSRGGWPRRNPGRVRTLQPLADIWEASLKLNQLIRRFDPNHDDVEKPVPPPVPDPRQLSLIDA